MFTGQCAQKCQELGFTGPRPTVESFIADGIFDNNEQCGACEAGMLKLTRYPTRLPDSILVATERM